MRPLRIVVLVAVLWRANSAVADGPQPRPPNVVLILSDDQHWGDYGFMGHEHLRTPALDRLARESLVFTRGYVPSSLCCPSLASLITGRYPHEHKIVGNDPPENPPGPPRVAGRQGRLRGRPGTDEPPSRSLAHAAEAPRRARLQEPADRQVVAGGFPAGRLRRGDDQRAAAWRRGARDRPEDDGADL